MIKPILDDLKAVIDAERKRAMKEHPLFSSPHEALGVIDEEVQEAKDEMAFLGIQFAGFRSNVHYDTESHLQLERLGDAARKTACELIQVAAMCDKAIESMEVTNEFGKFNR